MYNQRNFAGLGGEPQASRQALRILDLILNEKVSEGFLKC